MIDWNNLKGDKRHSFERFCYVLAKRIYGEKGKFTDIDDSGGGDGVEFYLTLPNEDEWGWQAKFFYPSGRLKQSNRKIQIKKSVKKALEVHTNLKKLFLCTPLRFTPAEIKWLKSDLLDDIKKDLNQDSLTIEIPLWNEGNFDNFLSKPEMIGIRNYFFGVIELDFNFFKQQFELRKSRVRQKYLLDVHQNTNAERNIYEAIVKKGEDLKKYLKNLNNIKDDLLKIQKKLVSLQNANKLKKVNTFDDYLDHYWKNVEYFIQVVLDYIEIIHSANIIKNNTKKIEINSNSKIEEYKENLFKVDKILKTNKIRTLYDKFLIIRESLKSDLQDLQIKSLIVFGEAGIGKTQISCHICDKLIERSTPVVFLLGEEFTTTQRIEIQIIQNLGLNLNWNEFLDSLSIMGEIYKRNIPIIIDGVNESEVNGKFPKIWRKFLPYLIESIKNYPNIKIIAFCRPSYKDIIADNYRDIFDAEITLKGFHFFDVEGAAKKYFEYFNININFYQFNIDLFQRPLFLRIFCEVNQNQNIEKIIELDILDIFRSYLELINKKICEKQNKIKSIDLIQVRLEKFAERIWKKSTRSLSIKNYIAIIENSIEAEWNGSIVKSLIEEGPLFLRDKINKQEEISFSFDLLGGYILANYLIKNEYIDIKNKKFSKELKNKLLIDEHPLSSDILFFIPIILQVQYNISPFELGFFNDYEKNRSIAIKSIFYTPSKYLSSTTIDFFNRNWKEIFNNIDFCRDFFVHAENPDNPLNANFLKKNLSQMKIAERDSFWTISLLGDEEIFPEILDNFKERIKLKNKDFEWKCLNLKFNLILWMLAITDRSYRNYVISILLKYAIYQKKRYLSNLIKFSKINDPFISEPLLAIGLYIAIRIHKNSQKEDDLEILSQCGRNLFTQFFAKKAKYSTTHFLIRNYARFIIELALQHNSSILDKAEIELLKPSYKFGGIRKWGIIDKKDLGKFLPKTRPISKHTFDPNVLKNLIHDKNEKDCCSLEFIMLKKNIYWRLYEFGYRADKFKYIDSNIDWMRHYRDGVFNDKFCEKYCLIIFFELVGLRLDSNLVDKSFIDKLKTYGYPIHPDTGYYQYPKILTEIRNFIYNNYERYKILFDELELSNDMYETDLIEIFFWTLKDIKNLSFEPLYIEECYIRDKNNFENYDVLGYYLQKELISKEDYDRFINLKNRQKKDFTRENSPSIDQLRKDIVFLENFKSKLIYKDSYL